MRFPLRGDGKAEAAARTAGETSALVRTGPVRQSTTVLVASGNVLKVEAVRSAFARGTPALAPAVARRASKKE